MAYIQRRFRARKCRTEFASGLVAYYVTFPDASTVGFGHYEGAYTAGAADVDGLIGFPGATLAGISGAIQGDYIQGYPDRILYCSRGDTATLDALPSVLVPGAITYKWYSMTELGGTATVIKRRNIETYTVPGRNGNKVLLR